jgi:hypothetical protein
MSWHGYVNFHDVLLAVHRNACGIGMPSRVLQNVRTAPRFLHEHITAKLQRRLDRAADKLALQAAFHRSINVIASVIPHAQRSVSAPATSGDRRSDREDVQV